MPGSLGTTILLLLVWKGKHLVLGRPGSGFRPVLVPSFCSMASARIPAFLQICTANLRGPRGKFPIITVGQQCQLCFRGQMTMVMSDRMCALMISSVCGMSLRRECLQRDDRPLAITSVLQISQPNMLKWALSVQHW